MDDDTAVRIGKTLTFSECIPLDYGRSFLIDLHINGLTARTPCEITTDLAGFVQELADGFRGWPGERAWRDRTLAVTAVHRHGGVELAWTVQDGTYHDPEWSVAVHTIHQAGEGMLTLARDLRAFLYT